MRSKGAPELRTPLQTAGGVISGVKGFYRGCLFSATAQVVEEEERMEVRVLLPLRGDGMVEENQRWRRGCRRGERRECGD